MAQQTAVSWLEEKIELDMSVMEILGLIRQAKQMEKELIINSYLQGCFDEELDHNKAEQYYNKTYGKL